MSPVLHVSHIPQKMGLVKGVWSLGSQLQLFKVLGNIKNWVGKGGSKCNFPIISKK